MTRGGARAGGTPSLKRLRRLSRRRSQRSAEAAFVIDGPVLLADALEAGVDVEEVLAEPAAPGELLEQAASQGATVRAVAPGALAKATDTVTPQPVAAIAPIPDVLLGDALDAWATSARDRPPSAPFSLARQHARDAAGGRDGADPAGGGSGATGVGATASAAAGPAGTEPLVLVLVGVADPGNAGTLLRSAEAAGAGAVVFCDDSVDPYGPKCVRSSAGALFRLAVVREADAGATLESLCTRGVLRVATVARGEHAAAYDKVDLSGPVAVVLGNEAHGLPSGLESAVDATVTIPMLGRTESLNVAMAGTILCFESLRQRRGRLPRPAPVRISADATERARHVKRDIDAATSTDAPDARAEGEE